VAQRIGELLRNKKMNGHASLNRLYRLVWSQVTQSWHAVSELTKSSGKGGSRSRQLVLSTLASVVLAGGSFKLYAQQAPPVATQLPTGGVVAQGAASVAQTATAQAARMTINQSSQRAVINWNSFNVGQNASVVFNQPNAQAVTLNRIADQNPSQIYGQMQANGQVFLTNPNGVYFSPTSQVDVGALVATTHSISDANFMAGSNVFSRNGATGKVVNDGQLNAALGGYIALLAPEVQNAGVVIARAGSVALASGEVVTLNFDGNHSLAGISTTPSTMASLIENRQAVQAPDGQIIISAVALDKLQAGVIRNSGRLSANSLSNKGGQIVLEADDITLSATSAISSTGPTGGGTVLVGGDWQGGGNVRQATKVTMDAGATIDASATDAGDGGKVVLWSDVRNAASQTQVHGRIDANAGPRSGNGGEIETSGHALHVNGIGISTQAPAGATGTWLLDPTDFTIAPTGGDITGAALSSAIDSSRVVIQSDSSLNGNIPGTHIGTANSGGQGDIVINDNISWTTKTSSIILKASGVIYGTGNIAFNATSTSYFQTPLEGVISFNQAGDSVTRGLSYSGVISGGITLNQTFGSTVYSSKMPVTIFVNNLASGSSGIFAMSGVSTIDAPTLMLSKGSLSFQGAGGFSSSAVKVMMLNDANLDISGKTGNLNIAELSSSPTATAPTIFLGANSLEINAIPSLLSYASWSTPNLSYNTFNGVISGTGGVSLSGSSQLMPGQVAGLTFKGVNTYRGPTTIHADTILRLEGAGSVAASSKITNDGFLDIGGVTTGASITSLSGSGHVYLSSPATNAVDTSSYPNTLIPVAAGSAKRLTITNASDTFSGVISGTGALTVAGGTQVLTGTNTYTGDTTIDNGATLQIGNGGSAGALSATTNIVDNGTLTFNLTGSPTVANAISGSGAIHNDGTASIALTGSVTNTGSNVQNPGVICAGPCPFDITTLTTLAQIQAITNSEIIGLTTGNIQSLTATQIGYFTTSQITQFSGAQLAAMSTTQVTAMTTSQVAALSSTQLGAVTAAQMAALTTAQVAAMTTSQVAALSSTQLGAVTAAQMAALTTAQVAAMTTSQVAALSSTQLGAMTTSQLAAFTTAQVAALTSSQLAALSSAQQGALPSSNSSSSSVSSSTTPAQIQSLSNAQVAQLTPNQLGGLSSAQLMAFTPSQLSDMTPSQQAAMQAVNPVLSVLFSQANANNPATVGGALSASASTTGPSTSSSGAQGSQATTAPNAVVPTLAGSAPSPSTIMGLSGSQIGNMSVASVQAISPTALSVFSGAQVAAMSANQLSALSPAQVQSLSVQQMESLSTSQAQAVMSSNANALSPVQRSTLVALANGSVATGATATGGVMSASPSARAGEAPTLTATQVQSLQPADIRQLTQAQISRMTPSQVQTLSVKQMAALSPEQLSTMSRQQAVALMRNRPNGLNSTPSSFTPGQRAAVNELLSATVSTSNAVTLNASNGILPVTVMGTTTTGVGVRFDGQGSSAIKLQMADVPANKTVSPGNLNARYTTIETRNANNEVVTFKGAIIGGRLVLAPNGASARQMAKTELPNVLSSAIDTLAGGKPIALDSLKGVVLNMR
jgi:filamentous hemagglutinin family protein